MKNFKSETEKLLSILYPSRCAACGCYLSTDKKSDDFLLAPYFCSSCALSVAWSSEVVLGEHVFEGYAIPLFYEGAVKEAMIRLKFKSDVSSVPFFSSALEREIRCKFYGVKFDTFTCVPVTRSGLAERGYNQSRLIAEKVRIDAEYDFSLLRKDKNTGVQHVLSAEERKRNIESAYTLSPGRDVRGKTILLIDDIFTTGSTCDACARTLRLSGASSVYVACAAKRRWIDENLIFD